MLDRHAPAYARLTELALEAADLGSFDWDMRTGDVVWDERLCRLFGWDPESDTGRIEQFFQAVVAEDVAQVRAAIEQAAERCAEYQAEYRVRHTDGTIRWIEARGRVFPGDDGLAARMLGVVRDSTDLRLARDTVARTLEHMADGFFAVDRAWRLTYLNRPAEQLLEVERVWVLGRSLWDVAPSLVAAGYDATLRRAAASGRTESVEVYSVRQDRWFQLRAVPTPDGLTVYATDISARRASDSAGDESLDREERARRVFTYSAALGEAVAVGDVTEAITTLVLPVFGASGVLVALVDSGRLRVVGSAGYSPEAVQSLDGPTLSDESPIAEAARERRPLFIPSGEAYAAAYPHRAEVPSLVAKGAWAFLPLIVSGRSIGSLTIAFDAARDFPPEDRALLLSLSGLLAQAIERARLREAEHELAAALQQALLPRDLPEIAGVRPAARYLPATDGIEVGGDWYDVIALPAGGVGLVVGDVQGHNVAAAAIMGQLRNALRAYATEGHDPATVLSRTNRLMTELHPDVFATCCYVAVDPLRSQAHVVRAGHPPPLLRRASGRVDVLEAGDCLPLGVDEAEVFTEERVALDRGDVLLLYTDGLVEGPRRSLAEGTADVVATLADLPRDDVEAAAEAVVSAARRAEHRADDVAVLVAVHDGLPTSRRPLLVSLEIDRASQSAVRDGRHFVAGALRAWELPELVDVAVMLTSEVLGNAVRHTSGSVLVEVRRMRDRVRVEVVDEATLVPLVRPVDVWAESGRGLHLLDGLSLGWGTDPRGAGKAVWFELALP